MRMEQSGTRLHTYAPRTARSSNRDILGEPHRSAGASRHAVHKMHPAAGGSEEFVRIPAHAALLFPSPPPIGSHARRHVYQSSPAYHTRACIPARCFTKCTHCTGFNHPPRGRTSSFGAGSAPRRDNGRCVLYERKKEEKDEEERGAAQERARRAETSRGIGCDLLFRLLFMQSARFFLRFLRRPPTYVIKTAFVISEVPRINSGNIVCVTLNNRGWRFLCELDHSVRTVRVKVGPTKEIGIRGDRNLKCGGCNGDCKVNTLSGGREFIHARFYGGEKKIRRCGIMRQITVCPARIICLQMRGAWATRNLDARRERVSSKCRLIERHASVDRISLSRSLRFINVTVN